MARLTGRGRAPAILWVVLGLVLVSFGLLVTALVTSTTGWAWGSVGASGVAAGLLVADWLGRRRYEHDDRSAAAAADLEITDGIDSTERRLAGTGATDVEPADDDPGPPGGGSETADADEPAAGPVGGGAVAEPAGDRSVADRPDPDEDLRQELDQDTEPAEENSDIVDTLRVSELPDEVVVIDERPRYHRSGCRWVGARATIPLPVSEARELGFTPCGICRPDAALTARHRAARR